MFQPYGPDSKTFDSSDAFLDQLATFFSKHPQLSIKKKFELWSKECNASPENVRAYHLRFEQGLRRAFAQLDNRKDSRNPTRRRVAPRRQKPKGPSR
jgi:hypothetical protein